MDGMWHYIIIIIIIIIIMYSRIQQYILKVTDCTTALNMKHKQFNITSNSDAGESIK
jgi:hypothetical protein